jgi:hypothetical protein
MGCLEENWSNMHTFDACFLRDYAPDVYSCAEWGLYKCIHDNAVFSRKNTKQSKYKHIHVYHSHYKNYKTLTLP